MVFSSHIFVFYFLLLSVGLYYAAPRRMKHLLLTLVSYVFYGWGNPWFVFLMLFSTAIDYWCGKIISAEGASRKRRKSGMMLSVVSNLAPLFFFKYATFAAGSVSGLADLLGWEQVALPSFFYHIVLPVGISFYTFQSMSYCIDLYRGHAEPSDSCKSQGVPRSLRPRGGVPGRPGRAVHGSMGINCNPVFCRIVESA